MTERFLVAVDIGNSRVKAGLIEIASIDDRPTAAPADRLPRVHDAVRFAADAATDWSVLKDWLQSTGTAPPQWWVAGVNPPVLESLQRWFRRKNHRSSVLSDPADLPLHIDLPQPESAGIDRLLAAVAANAVRPSGKPAIVVDAGSAMTVDAISAEGVFLGGAILPGLSMASRALHEFTQSLPQVNLQRPSSAQPPCPVGKNTTEALTAGLLWGSVGAVRELIGHMSSHLGGPEPMVILTGGDAPHLAAQLDDATLSLPNLTLQGIAITAAQGEG